jgi:hypothetical protein
MLHAWWLRNIEEVGGSSSARVTICHWEGGPVPSKTPRTEPSQKRCNQCRCIQFSMLITNPDSLFTFGAKSSPYRFIWSRDDYFSPGPPDPCRPTFGFLPVFYIGGLNATRRRISRAIRVHLFHFGTTAHRGATAREMRKLHFRSSRLLHFLGLDAPLKDNLWSSKLSATIEKTFLRRIQCPRAQSIENWLRKSLISEDTLRVRFFSDGLNAAILASSGISH